MSREWGDLGPQPRALLRIFLATSRARSLGIQYCTKIMPHGIMSFARTVSCPVMAGKDIVCWKCLFPQFFFLGELSELDCHVRPRRDH
eukprot:s2315_g19.t1